MGFLLLDNPRSWESARSRFHDVILANIDSDDYDLDKPTVNKFRRCRFPSQSSQASQSDETLPYESSTDSVEQLIVDPKKNRR